LKKYTSLAQIQQDISLGATTAKEIVSYYLTQIEKNKHLNAYLEVFDKEAISRAEEITAKIKSGTAGKLAGMVIAIKDNICYKGHRVSAASKILEGFVSTYSSTVVERILAEDAIIIGRLNCDEFAMGASNENSAYGTVRNAANNDYVSGGSSGGAAVAVQADLCFASLGSDTGGSIRQPAAFCGAYGLKPTYGVVSRWGLIAYASSFDQIGPITKNPADAQLILEVIMGPDGKDATVSEKVKQLAQQPDRSEQKTKIAVLKECIYAKGLSEEVKQHMLNGIEDLRNKGCIVEEVSFPYLDYLVPIYYILTTAEASSNLSRFSGLMYGYRSKTATDLESTYKKSRTEGFGEEVKRRIMLGTFVLSSGYIDAYYTKAQKARRLVRDKTNEIFKEYDFILSPTTPTPAFKIGEKSADPIAMYLADIFTVHANISGNPAISVPVGESKLGLPIGMQLMGRHFEDMKLLNFVKSIYSNK
jgi:aspartyl-tRNA(Asn)/glutamyl-tRNA(Gln) amidotransferase subunit A